jgi:hypothetical protein
MHYTLSQKTLQISKCFGGKSPGVEFQINRENDTSGITGKFPFQGTCSHLFSEIYLVFGEASQSLLNPGIIATFQHCSVLFL